MNYWPLTSFVSLWHFETFDKSLILFLLTQMSNNILSYISKININACCHWVWKHIFKSTEYICYLSKTHQKCVPNYVSGITISWEHFISTWICIKTCCLSMIEIGGFRYKSYSIPCNWHYSSYNTHTRTMKYLGLLILVSGSFALPRVSCDFNEEP